MWWPLPAAIPGSAGWRCERRDRPCGGGVSAPRRSDDFTAKALSLHRSTLPYRLQRIREVSGRDHLTNSDTRFIPQRATRAWKAVQAMRQQPEHRHHANPGRAAADRR